MSSFVYKNFLGVIAVCTLVGCTARIDQRGKLPESEKLTQLKPGHHTKEDVLRLIGSPTTVSAFDERIWLYVHRTTETKSFFDPKVLDQKQTVITFNNQGVLKEIKVQQGEKDLVPSKNVTPSAGFEPGWLQQVFGSYGRFAKKGRPD